MARPKSNRYVFEPPMFREFKPVGVAARSLNTNKLTLDEYEAIRLADYQGLLHEEAASEMGISRSTFSRLVVAARRKVSDSLINGKMLTIGGGKIHFRNNIIRCLNCRNIFKIKINSALMKCPVCGSANLQNLAGGYGHGRCCANH
ncbi:MAG: DUF134 domain-containing protein [Bacteroidales bacterium]|nr:DUF134 domain-containing protein [Bacteroidales bacterium]